MTSDLRDSASDKAAWLIRAGRGARFFESFLEEAVVGISWEIGVMGDSPSREEIQKRVEKVYPDGSQGTNRSATGQIFRFLNELAIGDVVVTYDPNRRIYVTGSVESDCEFESQLIPGVPTIRRVKWTHGILRDSLSASTRNSLGSIMTLFFAVQLESLAPLKVAHDNLRIKIDSPLSLDDVESEIRRILASQNSDLRPPVNPEFVEKLKFGMCLGNAQAYRLLETRLADPIAVPERRVNAFVE